VANAEKLLQLSAEGLRLPERDQEIWEHVTMKEACKEITGIEGSYIITMESKLPSACLH
jgi:hypothetical protein